MEVDRSEYIITSSEGDVNKIVERESSPAGQIIGIESFPKWNAKGHAKCDIWKQNCYFKIEKKSHTRLGTRISFVDRM